MNKKLSQLTEKVTSLNADDLLYVNVNGQSKSIKASTIEAPLKAYADQKKSELITEIETLDDKVDGEISNRQAADDSYLELAKAYTNSELSSIQSQIQTISSANSDIYNNATMYTNAEVESLRSAVSSDLDNLSSSIFATYATQEGVTSQIGQFETFQVQVIDSWLSNEASSRESADATTLQSAKDYTDAEVLEEQSARSAADATNLQTAKNYTDAAIASVSTSSGSVPTGVISMFAGTVAPSGYLLCDGSAISRSTNSALFNVLGTSFGAGDGTTTFNLPNPDGNANIRYIIKL
jgi:hypothetical protein